MKNLTLCRSDNGDGGWSLHAPGATDEEIRNGDAPAILSGDAEWVWSGAWADGQWDRPDAEDYARAERIVQEGRTA
jgi:hypothetical protein